MDNMEMLIGHVLLYMLCYIMPCLLMPYMCPVADVFIAMNMPICCSRFLLTSWYLVVSLLLSDPCLLRRCSNYMFWNMLWVICSHAMFANFGYHMPLFRACKHAIIMLLFYTSWNCFNIQSCHIGSTNPWALYIWCHDVICSLLCLLWWHAIVCHL